MSESGKTIEKLDGIGRLGNQIMKTNTLLNRLLTGNYELSPPTGQICIVQNELSFSEADLNTAITATAEKIATLDGHVFMVPPTGAAELFIAICALWRENRCAVPWRTDMGSSDYLLNLMRADHVLAVSFDSAETCDISIETVGSEQHARADHREWPIDQTDLVFCSSGTTGNPKAILVKKESFLENCHEMGKMLRLSERKLDFWTCSTDIGFTSAIDHLFMALAAETTFFHLDGISQSTKTKQLAKKSVGYGGSPLSVGRFVEQFHEDGIVKLVMTSGDFLRPAMVRRMVEKMPHLEIAGVFGLSELCGRVGCALEANKKCDEADTFGSFAMRALNQIKIDIRNDNGERTHTGEVGDLFVRSTWLAHGYIHEDGRFESLASGDGGNWYRTGDRARMLDDGRFVLTGRDVDVFKVGGEQVSRTAIETALSHDLVEFDYAVVATTHELLGQVPVLLVSASEDKMDLLPSRAQLIKSVRDQLSTKHVPFHYLKTEQKIPRTRSGKTLLNEVAKLSKESTAF